MASPAPPADLRRTVGPWQVMLYGTGSMLGAGIYALIGKAAGVMGSMLWLAFLAAMVAALLTGLSYACAGSRFPKAAGAAYVVGRAFRAPWLSYAVGISVTMSGLTSMATGTQAIAETLERAAGFALPVKLVAVGLVAAIGLVIFAGIRQSMWVNMACTLVEVGGLLFIIAVGARFWGSASLAELPPPPPGGAAQALPLLVLQGAVLTFFAFIGFEDILNVSEEVVRPERNVPLGLIGAMVFSTLVYLAVAVTSVSVLPWETLARSNAPLMDVARAAAPWFRGIDGVFLGITVFSIGNTALLNYLMGSRLLFGMSRQGLLPSFLGQVNRTTRTPDAAILVLFAIVSALIAAGGIRQLAEATVLLLLSVFAVVNAALLALKRRPEEPPGRFEVPAAIPALGCAVCVGLLLSRCLHAVASGDPSARVAPLVAGGIVAGSLVLFLAFGGPRRSGGR